MAKLLANVHSYHSAATFLGNRDERKLAHNTYVYRVDDETIGVTLHNTRIVTYHLDGRVQLNSGGWSTYTTKERINRLLPDGYSLWQHKFNWFVQHRDWPFAIKFEDNMVINASGEPPSHPHAINPMGPHKSFRQCVRSVSHRKRKPRNPRAYCGAIKARTERNPKKASIWQPAQKGPGKFEGEPLLTALLYDSDGDAQVSDEYGEGWAELFVNLDVSYPWQLDEYDGEPPPAAIITEDTNGFVYGHWYESNEDAREAFAVMERELSGEVGEEEEEDDVEYDDED